MTIYRLQIENPRAVRINEFSTVAGYKINIQKPIVISITNYQQTVRKRNKENNPTHNCIRKNKLPRNKSNQGGETPVLRKL